jgi:hypothetical protein
MKKEPTYYRALSAWKSFGILPIMAAIIWGVFMTVIGFGMIPITLSSPTGMIPNPAFEGLAALLIALFAYTALYLAACGLRMAMFRMEQAEEHHRSTKEALAKATSDLTREFRRRPDISSPVMFSLFGRSADAARVVPVKIAENGHD